METVSFIYKDAQGVVTARTVIDISETEKYIQAFCTQAQELRTFRKDRIIEYIQDEANIPERLSHLIANSPSPKPVKHRIQNDGNLSEVCFTGFKEDDKMRLSELAKKSSMFVRTSVTSNLEFLVCGFRAGKAKIQKARHQGVIVLTESQFMALLETGEIPIIG